MRIVCFGDSNTYGYDPRSFFGDRYPEEQIWVNILAQKMNCRVVNAGEMAGKYPEAKGNWLNLTGSYDQSGRLICC